jgi:hypothetical protein
MILYNSFITVGAQQYPNCRNIEKFNLTIFLQLGYCFALTVIKLLYMLPTQRDG